jgi:WD40 repeat protein
MDTPPDRKYAVFISYRHADNKEQGRQWATWLHHTLETYEVPPDLIGRTNLRGEPVPASLYPVFRDEEELPADADLSANIQRALTHSALLVVLCSPRAVESRFVADEIRVFKELGKAGHILALMIDGEPNAADDPAKARAGIHPEHECLPHPLRYGVPRGDGSIDWTQRTEPIAADVRPENRPVQGWTTTAAYREELTRQGLAKTEIDLLAAAYEEQLQLATMKIIAGAIGLPLGEVTQRDKRHAEEKLRRARQELSRTEFLFARQLLDLAETQGEDKKHESAKRACAHLAIALRANPENQPAIILGGGHVMRFANRGVVRMVSGSGGQLSACGKYLLGWSENEALIWDTSSASLAARKIKGQAKVRFAVFNRRGSQVFTTYDDGTSGLWDVGSGESASRTINHGSRLKFAQFFGDDSKVAALTENGILSVISLRPEGCAKPPQVHLGDPIDRFAVCNDGSRLLLAGSNGVKVFETRDLRLLAGGSSENGRRIHAAAFSPDGERMVIATENRATVLHCVSGKRCVKNLTHPGPVRVAAYSPDGHMILTGSDDQFARLWNADSGALIREIAHPGPVLGGLFSPDGMRALTAFGPRSEASSSDDELLEVLTSMLSSIINETKPDNSGVAFNADTICLSAFKQSSAWLWDVGSEEFSRHALFQDRELSSISFNSDGSRIAMSTQDGRSEIWDAATKGVRANSLVLNEPIRSAQFVDEVHVLLLSGDQGRRVSLCDIRTGDIVKEFQSQKSERSQPVRAVFNRGLGQLLLVDERGSVEAGDLQSGEMHRQPLLHERAVLTADLSPDGRFVLTGSADCSARMWSLHSGAVVAGPLRHSGWIRCCQFSPNGNEIVTASDDGTARIWDAQSGVLKVPPLRHLGPVRSAAFSPDGTKVITASNDGTARIWNAQSGSPRRPHHPTLKRGGVRTVQL